jgi:hypothetical protein
MAEFHIHTIGKEELNMHTISMAGFHYSYLKIHYLKNFIAIYTLSNMTS